MIISEDEEEVAHFDFGPKEAVFAKPTGAINQLKTLYVRGHIDGVPVSHMLVDGGAIINVMPYALYRKLGKSDGELVKTNMTLSGIGGENPIEAKGVASMELTIGSKTVATAFFVAEIQANYSLILRRDWIHASLCVPSTLHQCLMQWVGNEVEVVYANESACIATADAPAIWAHDSARCLTGVDLTDYQYLGVSKDGFIPVMVELAQNRLNHIM